MVVPTLAGLATPSANDQAANKLYVDDLVAAALGEPNYSGAEIDGTGLGAPVSTITAGFYNFEELTITSVQTLTGPTTIFCSGDITISGTGDITGNFPLSIRANGNITLGKDITVRGGLDVRCNGTLTLGGAIVANSGLTRETEVLGDIQRLGSIRMVCGVFDDAGSSLVGNDIALFCFGDAAIAGSWAATWRDSGGYAASSSPDWNGNVWAVDYGTVKSPARGTNAGAEDGGGGGGGTGGGAGGSGVNGTATGGTGDSYKSGFRPHLMPFESLRRGGGGGGAGNAGGRGGGRVSIYVGGDAVLTGATISAAGAAASSSGSEDPGGGGGGIVRVVVKGTLTDGDVDASGGAGAPADGGGGGGGGAFINASAMAGTQTTDVTAGGSSSGGPGAVGTASVEVLTADQIQALVDAGIFTL